MYVIVYAVEIHLPFDVCESTNFPRDWVDTLAYCFLAIDVYPELDWMLDTVLVSCMDVVLLRLEFVDEATI